MADIWDDLDGDKLTGPLIAGEAVDVSVADQVLSNTSRALWVGGAGNVEVVMNNGDTLTFTGVTAGYLLPVRATQVNTAGTTAANILALW